MELRITRFFKQLVSRLEDVTEKATDRLFYINALSDAGEDKPEGFFSLGNIYERGSAFVSHDAAMAYAMYCLSAERKMDVSKKKALQLKSQLNARDWINVNKTLKNFDSNYKV